MTMSVKLLNCPPTGSGGAGAQKGAITNRACVSDSANPADSAAMNTMATTRRTGVPYSLPTACRTRVEGGGRRAVLREVAGVSTGLGIVTGVKVNEFAGAKGSSCAIWLNCDARFAANVAVTGFMLPLLRLVSMWLLGGRGDTLSPRSSDHSLEYCWGLNLLLLLLPLVLPLPGVLGVAMGVKPPFLTSHRSTTVRTRRSREAACAMTIASETMHTIQVVIKAMSTAVAVIGRAFLST